jgi:para-nitrobenzyl esterase
MVGGNPPQELADHIHRLWVGFGRDGGLPWAPFDRDKRLVYSLVDGLARPEPVMPAQAFLP